MSNSTCWVPNLVPERRSKLVAVLLNLEPLLRAYLRVHLQTPVDYSCSTYFPAYGIPTDTGTVKDLSLVTYLIYVVPTRTAYGCTTCNSASGCASAGTPY